MHTLASRCRSINPRRWVWASHIPSRPIVRPQWVHNVTYAGRPNPGKATFRAFTTAKDEIKNASKVYTGIEAEPTIYALSSAPGRAAIAVVRISGPGCLDVYRTLCPSKAEPQPRLATVRALYEPSKIAGEAVVLDPSALVLYFPSPATATGEDVLELHVHGGPAIVKAVLAAIPKCFDGNLNRIRYAEPGEFTRRAFLNGRLDLTQVEALGDSLAAETEQQRRLAVRGANSNIARRYEAWRQQLLYARGELEALIDFSEDQHFDESPADLCASVAEQVLALIKILRMHIQNAMRGEMLRHGISLSFLGAPNAGKSSLLNRIVGREAAIVSSEAGTTRDVVEVGLDLGGYFCRLGDTAGLRQATRHAEAAGNSPAAVSPIEREGMRRAKERAAASDLVVVVLSFEAQIGNGGVGLCLDAEVCAAAAALAREKSNVMVVVNKKDLTHESTERDAATRAVLDALPGVPSQHVYMISCIDDDANGGGRVGAEDAASSGIQAFLHGLIRQFARLTAAESPAGARHADPDGPDPSAAAQESLGATARHRMLLEACVSHLGAFLLRAAPSAEQPCPDRGVGRGGAHEPDLVLAAEDLRSAAECLARITGKGEAGDVEEVLGVVFEKFCVGK